jgi:hypothetical protein
MSTESSGKPDAWKLARPVWGWGRGETPRSTPPEEEFTERLSVAIWRANGAYCEVTVNATYLENLPYETHCLNEADYARLIDKQQEQQDANGPGR